MKTYNLKSGIRRGSMLVAALVVAGSAILPATSASADALNPLTDRSLTLSSSAPGWDFLDGSGNATFAQPNSGANGKKTGNTFSFKVSTDTTGGASDYVQAMTFQYCTYSAGDCMGPGNNGFTGDTGAGTGVAIPNSATTDAAKTSDLEIVVDTNQSEIPGGSFGTYVNSGSGLVTAIPAPATTGQNFVVYYNDGGTWTQSTGWDMAVAVEQYGDQADGESTNKANQINLTNATGQGFEAGQEVKIVFFATDSNYITNPGDDAFFVKINTYNDTTTWDDTTLIDGGVTVANVMNEGIQITTKVLETMDFSVGTVDPYTLEALPDLGGSEDETSQLFNRTGNRVHGVCDPVLQGMDPLEPNNTLQLGNELGEFSLETAHTYSTHSYWRLSSNSSAGATVYYSGVTLQNTVGDEITAINNGNGVKASPIRGSEQFGLAMATNADADLTTNYDVEREPEVDPNYGIFENGADNLAAGLADALNADIHASVESDTVSNVDANASWHRPQLAPIAPLADYNDGAGIVNPEYGGAADTQFAFDVNSNTIPTPFAQGTEVVDCVTGKMRYVANIAATTPAGIYTTKINYIAAPQY